MNNSFLVARQAGLTTLIYIKYNEHILVGYKISIRMVVYQVTFSCMVYIAIYEVICKLLGLEDYSKKIWVYVNVGVLGSFLSRKQIIND